MKLINFKSKFKNFLSENIFDFQHSILWIFIIFAIGILSSYHGFLNLKIISCLYILSNIAVINIIFRLFFKKLNHLNADKLKVLSKISDVLTIISIIIIAFIIGYIRMSIRISNNHTVMIDSIFVNIPISGNIDKIEIYKNKYRLTINNISSEALPVNIHKILFDIKIDKFEKNKLNIGDKIKFYASIFQKYEPIFIKDFDYKKYLFYHNISGIGKITEIINKSKQNSKISITNQIKNKIETTRYKITKYIQKNIPSNISGIIIALTTGERNLINKHIQKNYRNSGISHILAISGFHTGIIATILFIIIRLSFTLIYPISSKYDTKNITYPIVIFILTIYLFLSGTQISTQRAYIMTVSYIIALMFGKSPISIHLLFFAGFLILIISPESIIDVGFVLSFISVSALITVFSNPTIKNFLKNIQNKSRIYHGLFIIFLTTITANIATSIPVIYYFEEYSIISIFTNIIAIPIFTFAVMPLILMYLTLNQITNYTDPIFIKLLDITITLLNNVAGFMAKNFQIFINLHVSNIAMGLFIIGIVIFTLFKNKFIGLIIIFVSILSVIFQNILYDYHTVIINKNGYVIIKDALSNNVITFNILTKERNIPWKNYYKHNKISKRFGISTKSIYNIEYNLIDKYNFGNYSVSFSNKKFQNKKIPCFKIFNIAKKLTEEHCLIHKTIIEILLTKKKYKINFN